MGLKSYFRKPASKDVEKPEIEESASGALTPMAFPVHTPMSQESADPQSPMYRLNDARCELMVNHIWSQQAKLLWYTGDEDEGVVIKQSRGQHVCCPPDLCRPGGFYDAVKALNVKVSIYLPIVCPHTDRLSERHDGQHACDQDPHAKQRPKLHPNQ
jgi:hypothetical protein